MSREGQPSVSPKVRDTDPSRCREGQVWRIRLSAEGNEMVGLVVEDEGTWATLLVLHAEGVFEQRPVGTLSRDKMTEGWKTWCWERIS